MKPAAQSAKPAQPHEFDSIALLLQGGGALGAYQIGVYEALAEAELFPDWVIGYSIGALNGAIIAGNKPQDRMRQLQGFWEKVTSSPQGLLNLGYYNPYIKKSGTITRTIWDQMNAVRNLFFGAPGFFKPHAPPWLCLPGTQRSTSYYDTDALQDTLRQFVDFDILNSGRVRYSTAAVNVRTGNYTIFDTKKQKITPAHVMSSGALPPALPAVEIEGEYYWDAGVISNTPLQMIMDEAMQNTLAFQVDLWSSKGEIPQNILDVETREKEIRYSSRTRTITDRFRRAQKMRHNFAKIYKLIPEDIKNTEEVKSMKTDADYSVYNIVHLIYRARHYEGFGKDYEFSPLSMCEHWKSGYKDTASSLQHKEIFKRPTNPEGIMTFDVSQI